MNPEFTHLFNDISGWILWSAYSVVMLGICGWLIWIGCQCDKQVDQCLRDIESLDASSDTVSD
jgi:hypothetical protein